MRRTVARTAIAAIAGIAAVTAGSALAQLRPGSQQGLGLTGADIPPILQQIKAEPYRAPAEPACETIPREILALNEVLGPDVEKLKTRRGVGQMAAGYVRHLIPYRGVVRFLTRADSRDQALQDAAIAGYARRGFLRGLEANLHCAGPAPLTLTLATAADAAAPASATVAATIPVKAGSPAGEGLVKVMLDPAPETPRPADAVRVEVSDPAPARVASAAPEDPGR